MEPKRTMHQALRSADLHHEAAAFLSAGTPKVAELPASTVQPEKERTPVGARPSPLPEARRTIFPGRPGQASITVRLPAELPDALLRIALERKLRGERPCTQQDIVAEALREWFERQADATQRLRPSPKVD